MTATEIEKLVSMVWAQTLKSGEPGPDDDFLAAGGHSLLAMRLAAALSERTGRRIAVGDILGGRTPAGMAERVALAPQASAAGGRVPGGAAPALSPAQRRMWFVEQLTPGVPAHNIAMVERLSGRLDVDALRTALRAVAERQEVLRYRLPQSDGVPSVVVDPAADVPLDVHDLSTVPEPDREAALESLLAREARTPFDLAAGPLWRARLIRLAPDRHVLSITVHHVVFDGWSRRVLYRDLARAYQDALLGRAPSTRPLPATFADYVAWLAEQEATSGVADLEHWTRHLDGAPLVLDLPRDRPRPPVQTFRGAGAAARIGREASARLRRVAAEAGATPAAALLAVFGQLLYRLTGEDDLVVGMPVADRRDLAFEPLVGFCVQMLPLRVRVSGEEGFREHVRRCRDEIARALEHPDLPMERIVERLGGSRDLSRNPLVQVLFNMYDFTESHLDLPGVSGQQMTPGLPGSLFDLTLYVSDRDDEIALQATYNPDLYDQSRIQALLAGYVTLLDGLTAEPDRAVRESSLRPAGAALPDWSQPLPDWDGPGLLERIGGPAPAAADALAVTGSGGQLTYGDLARIGARTAEAIRTAGMAAGEVVAVLADRDVLLAPVLAGVLASGCRWLVLDPSSPAAVQVRNLTAARARGLILFPGTTDPDPDHTDRVRWPAAELAAASADVTDLTGTPPAPAATRGYLSLSSGTTGLPKPIEADERPLAHFVDWYPKAFGLAASDRFALLAGLAHDPLLRDLFTPLVLGARLCVPQQAWLRDPVTLSAWLRDEQVTVLHLTPQLARLLTTTGTTMPAVRLIALAGDRALHSDVLALRTLAPRARIVNFYGATETPQAQSFHEVVFDAAERDRGGPVPVGRGIDGVQLLVLDRAGRPAGVGECGEVVIRSRYLATGYTDPDLTARRFGSTEGGTAADRFFRTGDLGRHLPDGTVMLAGRTDDQVKIRGYRVELGEVETVLAAHPDVRAACVAAAEENGERVLRAYAVPARAGVRVQQLHAHLAGSLPAYAVPADITLLPALPLTANGKVDRSALRRPALRPPAGRIQEAAGRTERVIAGVWSEVLGLPRLGATDNFFEVGGHSLHLVAIQGRLTVLLGRQIPVVDLFRYPSIRALATHLDGTGQEDALDRAARRAAQRRQRVRARTGNHPTDRER